MNFQEALSYINLGNCVLFVGSGFSFGAKNLQGDVIPTAATLAKNLYDACSEPSEDGELTDASELYKEKFGTEKLIEYLKNLFTVAEITPEQKIITSLPWKRVYTTNYDNIIELGYEKSGRVITPKVLSNRMPTVKDKTKICIHLNGYIEKLDFVTIEEEFKLTDVSYTSADFQKSEWITLFDSDLRTSDAVFFIGFSMKSDLDIKRVISANPENLSKCFFIVSNREKQPTLRILRNYGEVLPINVSGFVDEYKKIKPKTQKLSLSYKSFDCVKDISVPIEVIDRDVFNLLTLGTIDVSKVASSLSFPEKKYYIKRSVLDTIIEKVENGEKRILIHSDIGNGKSLLLTGLSILLYRKKYKVYKFNGRDYNLDYEIEQICKSDSSRNVFIIDNYSHYRTVLDSLQNFSSDSIIILSERSVINETATEWLFPKLGDFTEFDINTLTSDDINALMYVLDDFGFWSRKASASIYEKINYLSNDCKGRFRNVLLDLLKSTDVFNRFNKIIHDIQNKQGYYDALLLMLIGKVFNLNLDLEQVSLILGRERINSSNFRRNPTIAEFVNFDQGNIIVRSSLLAEVILSKLSNTTTVVDLLINVFKQLDTFRGDSQYKLILKTLLSYSNLQKVLNKTDDKYNENIYRFFEQVKTLCFCKHNPHFWLQYAILVLASRDYNRADKYFKTAYAYANRDQEFQTFAIDNHYARYILENELESGTNETCMEAFFKAHSILIDPIHKKKVRFYPYRVAQNYYPFFDCFYKTMSKKDQQKFLKCCEEICERAKSYAATAESAVSKKDVIKAIKLLEQIKNEAENTLKNNTRLQ